MADRLDAVAEMYGLTPEGVMYALEQYGKVIFDITYGRLSKLTYRAEDILRLANDLQCEGCELKEGPGFIVDWVSVKDRLPEEKENPLTHDFTEVICFCDFGGRPKRTDIRTYGFGKRCYENEPHFWHGPQIMDGVVTHWMPLPEPPKEDEMG